MALYTASLASDCIEYSRYSVTDIVSNNIPHEKRREINTHNGQHQIKPVERCNIETGGEQKLYLGDNPVKNITRYGSKHSHHETE
jgi:hypothetical protein